MKLSLKAPAISILILAAIAACLVSCGGGTPSDPLESAEEAFNDSRFAKAQALCDSLVLGDSFSGLSVDQLCRLSLLLAKLGENGADDEANTAFAAYSLRRALTLNKDSVNIFTHSLSMDDQARFIPLTVLAAPVDTIAIFQNDSIFEDDSIY